VFLLMQRIVGASSLVLTVMSGVGGPAPAAQRAGNRITLLDWTVPVAEGWVQRPATSTMRLAEFQVPGRPADGNAEVVVYYFGQGGGGSIDDNIERWVSQFSMPDGKAVQPVVTRAEAAGMPLTTVELRGTYARGVGMGPQGAALVNHTLLVCIVETPKGNLTFQLWGPRNTVATHRQGLEAMVQGIKATA